MSKRFNLSFLIYRISSMGNGMYINYRPLSYSFRSLALLVLKNNPIFIVLLNFFLFDAWCFLFVIVKIFCFFWKIFLWITWTIILRNNRDLKGYDNGWYIDVYSQGWFTKIRIPSVNYNLDIQLNEQTNQNSIIVPKVITNKKMLLKKNFKDLRNKQKNSFSLPEEICTYHQAVL